MVTILCTQKSLFEFTHINESSSPVSSNKLATDSTPSTCPSSINILISNSNSFSAFLNISCSSVSQNVMDGLVIVKIRTISPFDRIGHNGTIGQSNPMDAKINGTKWSLLMLIKHNF